MDFVKESVALADIRPSGTNPRKNFEGIDELAEAIRATGGEPVNPPVVLRDGNVYRIIDGERRYRALSKMYKGHESEVMVPVLVACDMDAANEMVAMLATDDKLRLSDEERAAGVQQMLILGVDEQTVSRASRATREQVKAAKKLARRVPEGAQVTLDQMVAAMQFERDEDRDSVLASGNLWYSEVTSIKSRIKREKRMEEVAEYLAGIGVQIVDEAPIGLESGGTLYSWMAPDELRNITEGYGEGCFAVADEDGEVRFYIPEGIKAIKKEELSQEQIDRRRGDSACKDLAGRMVAWAATGDITPCPELDDAALDRRSVPYLPGGEDADFEWILQLGVGIYERVTALLALISKVERGFMGMSWLSPKERAERAREWDDAVNVIVASGFNAPMTEDDEWLKARCTDVCDEGEK